MSSSDQHPPEWLLDVVDTIPDFPEPGIQFRDLSPLWASPAATSRLAIALAAGLGDSDLVAGIEARGFLTGMITAQRLGLGFVAIRKPGKLPGSVLSVDYDLEYGSDRVELQSGALRAGDRVAILDDVIATGGTAKAAAELVEQAGGEVVAIRSVLELDGLGGRDVLAGYPVSSLWTVS